jgi:hypothetical protein
VCEAFSAIWTLGANSEFVVVSRTTTEKAWSNWPFAGPSGCKLPKSESLCDWRFTANQFILATSLLRPTTRIFFQLNTCSNSPYVTSSLTIRWVCRLQLLLALASAVLRSEYRITHDHILLSQIRDPNLEDQVPVFVSPRNRLAQLYPQALGFPFCRLVRFTGLLWRYSTPPPHRLLTRCKLTSSHFI